MKKSKRMILDASVIHDLLYGNVFSPNPPLLYTCGKPGRKGKKWKPKREKYLDLINKLLQKGEEFEHFLKGTKMKEEFERHFNVITEPKTKNMAILKLLKQSFQGDKRIKRNYKMKVNSSNPKKITISIYITKDDKKYDDKINKFKLEQEKKCIDLRDKQPKELIPCKPKINDWHIIYATIYDDINYVHTTDDCLGFILPLIIKEFFKNESKLEKVYDRFHYMDLVEIN